MNTKTVTVLYYSDLMSFEIKVTTLKGLPFKKGAKRVKLPEGFTKGKIIIAVLNGEVEVFNHLGERAEKI